MWLDIVETCGVDSGRRAVLSMTGKASTGKTLVVRPLTFTRTGKAGTGKISSGKTPTVPPLTFPIHDLSKNRATTELTQLPKETGRSNECLVKWGEGRGKSICFNSEKTTH